MKQFLRLSIYTFYLILSQQVFAEVSFEIEGVEDQATIDNITVFLEGLSAPENANNDSYLTEVIKTTKESVSALGYYHTEVETLVIDNADDQVVIVKVTLGERTFIDEIDLRLT